MTASTRDQGSEVLFMALELSKADWKLGFGAATRKNPRVRTVKAGDFAALGAELDRARERFGLSGEAAVRTCYEAGLDGFWIHRKLTAGGIDNLVVDSASIEVDRRARRAKTDRIDAKKLVSQLMRYHAGERTALRIVTVPQEEDEDQRELVRERDRLSSEKTSLTNRARALLGKHGVRVPKGTELSTFLQDAGRLDKWDGQPLLPQLVARLQRIHRRVELVSEQLKQINKELSERLANPTTRMEQVAATLASVRGVGVQGAWTLAAEVLWRTFRNRREVGAFAGLTGTPYASGKTKRDQGISKSGNGRVRRLLIQLSWLWLRYQEDSALAVWWQQRFADGPRRRKIGIVGVARRLLIALWRLVKDGTVPEGAALKPAA